HCVHRQTFRLRACLDLFPDGLREADRTWACAADLKKFLGATSPDLDRYPLSGDPRRVRIPADRRLGELDLGDLAQRRRRGLAAPSPFPLLHIASFRAWSHVVR